MEKLSVVIITKNEEANIGRCLKAVEWADEILVVDSGSTDKTEEICREFGAIFIKTEWQGFSATKEFAVSKAKNNWILSIDADEVVSEALKNEITAVLQDKVRKSGYKIPFKLIYLGKKIRFCGVGHEYHLRLYDRSKGSIVHSAVHEGVRVAGGIGMLKSPIYHYSYPSLEVHLTKIKRYTLLSAKSKFEKGKRITVAGIIFRAIFKFIRNYIFLGGIFDGKAGFFYTINAAIYTYFTYAFLWEMNYRQKKNK